MKKQDDCIRDIIHKRIKVEENGQKAIFENPARQLFRTVHVDGCLVKNEVIADYIVNKVGVGSVIIEFKGTDVTHAYDQLLATATHSKCTPHIGPPKGMLIVCASWPETSTKKQRMESAATQLRFRLTVKTRQIECQIESLFFEEHATR